MSHAVRNISDDSFSDEVLKCEIPVLVDFWAEWCGPCKSVAPLLDEASAEFAGKLKIVKLDVDHNTTIPAKFGVRGIPTMMIFKDGSVVGQKVGAMAKGQLLAFINSNI